MQIDLRVARIDCCHHVRAVILGDERRRKGGKRGEADRRLSGSERDPACGAQIRFDNQERGIRYAMNNSFGFGGNNCSLVFAAA